MKQLLRKMFEDAHTCNTENIVDLIRRYPVACSRFVDLGAGDGTVTQAVLQRLSFEEKHAVELEPENADALERSGFVVHRCDLNGTLSIEADSFDVAAANQVIEHLYDTDCFLEEVYRILRPGGLAVISTENLASWHNIGSLVLGWQPFSLTNVTKRRGGLGNPLAFFRGNGGTPFPMQHHRLFTTRTLIELMSVHGFTELRVAGAGYYPFPAGVGRLEKQHAHFITVAGVKR